MKTELLDKTTLSIKPSCPLRPIAAKRGLETAFMVPSVKTEKGRPWRTGKTGPAAARIRMGAIKKCNARLQKTCPGVYMEQSENTAGGCNVSRTKSMNKGVPTPRDTSEGRGNTDLEPKCKRELE